MTYAFRRKPGFFVTLLILLASWIAAPHTALAHAVLQASLPSANATVDTTKTAGGFPVQLKFNSRIDAAHSSLSLMAADGKPVQLTVDTKADANVLRSKASGIQPGHYSLHWQVVAGDGHISRGAIPFNVR